MKDACPGPQEAHVSWRTESHRRNITRQGVWERRGEGPGQGCRGARGRGRRPAGNTGAGAQGPEGCEKRRGQGRASPVPTPRLRTRILFSGRVALLDPTVTLANQETAGKSQMAVSACLPNDLAPTAGRALKTHTEVTKGEWVTKTQEPGLWAVPPPTPKRAAHGHQAGSAPGGRVHRGKSGLAVPGASPAEGENSNATGAPWHKANTCWGTTAPAPWPGWGGRWQSEPGGRRTENQTGMGPGKAEESKDPRAARLLHCRTDATEDGLGFPDDRKRASEPAR